MIINICISARNLFEIYHNIALDTSELINNRILYYKDRINKDLELLREVHNLLQNSGYLFTDEHRKLLYDGKGLIIWELGKGGTEEGKVGIDASYSIGINKYISRVTDISGISEDVFRGHYENSKNPDIARLQHYILYNGENRLREIAERSSSYYLNEIMNSFDDNTTALYVFSSLGSICVTLILIFFIPYIMKIERNILVVFDYVSNIPSDDVKKILEKCYTFKEDIELPLDKLKVAYNDEDFLNTTEDQTKEETKEEEILRRKTKKAKILSGLTNKKKRHENSDNEKEEDDDLEDIDEIDVDEESSEKHYLLLVEKKKMEVKKKMFAAFVNSKRRNYFLLLFTLLIFFIIFFVADILILNDFSKKGKNTFDFINLFIKREYIYKTVVLFYRETLPITESLSFTRIFLYKYIRQ